MRHHPPSLLLHKPQQARHQHGTIQDHLPVLPTMTHTRTAIEREGLGEESHHRQPAAEHSHDATAEKRQAAAEPGGTFEWGGEKKWRLGGQCVLVSGM